MSDINLEIAAYLLFRERLRDSAKYLVHDTMTNKKYWNSGNPRLWDYWRETMGDGQAKQHYMKEVEQYLAEIDGAPFANIGLATHEKYDVFHKPISIESEGV